MFNLLLELKNGFLIELSIVVFMCDTGIYEVSRFCCDALLCISVFKVMNASLCCRQNLSCCRFFIEVSECLNVIQRLNDLYFYLPVS